jgi:amino acid transporter
MKNRESIAPIVVIILIILIAFGGIWSFTPMQFTCHLHAGSPENTIVTLIDPDKMDVPVNELHFQWAIAELKARILLMSSIVILFILIVYYYTKYERIGGRFRFSEW